MFVHKQTCTPCRSNRGNYIRLKIKFCCSIYCCICPAQQHLELGLKMCIDKNWSVDVRACHVDVDWNSLVCTHLCEQSHIVQLAIRFGILCVDTANTSDHSVPNWIIIIHCLMKFKTRNCKYWKENTHKRKYISFIAKTLVRNVRCKRATNKFNA